MLKPFAARRLSLKRFKLTMVLAPLALGVVGLVAAGTPVAARPLVIQSSPCASFIHGSPIPTPRPVNPYTGQSCSVAPVNSVLYNRVRTPRRGTIRDSTLINPTVIDSQVRDSVLINPVIINSPGSRTNRGTRIYRNQRVIQSAPLIQIRLGQ